MEKTKENHDKERINRKSAMQKKDKFNVNNAITSIASSKKRKAESSTPNTVLYTHAPKVMKVNQGAIRIYICDHVML